jgi:organic hydroperoxide reductase OsmC/OhrA
MDESFQVRLASSGSHRTVVDFGLGGVPALVVDEPAPVGSGEGPNAARVLATAVGQCLSSSLLFCLRKARVEVQGIETVVSGRMERNERGRLRIARLSVRLKVDAPADQEASIARCIGLFEDFCIVTQSVRKGIQVEAGVELLPGAVQVRPG